MLGLSNYFLQDNIKKKNSLCIIGRWINFVAFSFVSFRSQPTKSNSRRSVIFVISGGGELLTYLPTHKSIFHSIFVNQLKEVYEI